MTYELEQVLFALEKLYDNCIDTAKFCSSRGLAQTEKRKFEIASCTKEAIKLLKQEENSWDRADELAKQGIYGMLLAETSKFDDAEIANSRLGFTAASEKLSEISSAFSDALMKLGYSPKTASSFAIQLPDVEGN